MHFAFYATSIPLVFNTSCNPGKSIRHFPRDNQNKKTQEEEFKDKQLVEILFYIEDLRNLILTHQKIIQKYYCSLMHQFNAPALNEHLKVG